MKTRRHILHALLALLLVLSQQLGIAHAVSHWSGYRHGAEQLQEIDGSVSPGLALDHNCSQCLAFAQLATALHTPEYTFPAVDYTAPAGLLPQHAAPRARTVRRYDSRAPPLA